MRFLVPPLTWSETRKSPFLTQGPGSVTLMDPELRHKNLVAFYFGTQVALYPTSLAAIESISHRAYRDLSRTLHGIGSHPEKDVLLGDTHASLHRLLADLEKIMTQEEFDALHHSWCKNRIEFFNQHPHPDRKSFTLTYGQAQKWINMALKYLAVIEHSAVKSIYRYLHIPIDSIVYKEAARPDGLAVPRPPGSIAWSRLDRNQYESYQRELFDTTARKHPDFSPLDWEAEAWVTRSSKTDN